MFGVRRAHCDRTFSAVRGSRSGQRRGKTGTSTGRALNTQNRHKQAGTTASRSSQNHIRVRGNGEAAGAVGTMRAKILVAQRGHGNRLVRRLHMHCVHDMQVQESKLPGVRARSARALRPETAPVPVPAQSVHDKILQAQAHARSKLICSGSLLVPVRCQPEVLFKFEGVRRSAPSMLYSDSDADAEVLGELALVSKLL